MFKKGKTMKRRRKLQWVGWIGFLSVGFVGGVSSAGGADEPAADLNLGGWSEQRLSSEDHPGHLFRSRDATFNLGPVRYAIRYCACVDEAHGGQAAPIEGYIGMPAPSSANWYHSGFLFILLNGEDIGVARLSSITAVETGERAILDLVWPHRLANVRARFLGLPGEDKLLVEIALEPQGQIESITVRARCYPSFFTAWHKRQGARRAQTPSCLVREGEDRELPAEGNEWVLHYDEVFDVARGEGEGPCAMLVRPDEARTVRLAPGGYAVDTEVRYRPELRRLHLAFWDLAGRTNAEALKAMPQAAQRTQEQLAALDFTPTAVRTFDPEAARHEIATALKSQAVREQCGAKAEAFLAALDRLDVAFAPDRTTPAVRAEEEFLTWRAEYEEFRWTMKLVELLDF